MQTRKKAVPNDAVGTTETIDTNNEQIPPRNEVVMAVDGDIPAILTPTTETSQPPRKRLRTAKTLPVRELPSKVQFKLHILAGSTSKKAVQYVRHGLPHDMEYGDIISQLDLKAGRLVGNVPGSWRLQGRLFGIDKFDIKQLPSGSIEDAEEWAANLEDWKREVVTRESNNVVMHVSYTYIPERRPKQLQTPSIHSSSQPEAIPNASNPVDLSKSDNGEEEEDDDDYNPTHSHTPT
ncbi:protein of unknown function [Taphrina deformans PYCC 5710]|uniref:Uncharacterized protein n=1 Tax=Taphrina deformans (strain PYCC 5710 / ATCC 11124 / CBS 356.35 / IMI 108563 / JCM 9778 / NBRC 8474) TaxID=1097556 RepID=R4XI65_TAPDE|nr:protein of unknown function [Taphrina deformans PYCC 5710]|eukprot:CCG83082.1 protein of unknown function [Taphrina deformans PYCC 5710]